MVSAYKKDSLPSTAATALEYVHFLIPGRGLRETAFKERDLPVKNRLCLHLLFGVISGVSLLQRAAALFPTRNHPLLLRHFSYF